MTDNELHSMLEDFLSDNHTENNEAFVQKVMSELPAEPRFAWVRDVFPAVVFFVVMMTLWKFQLLTPTAVFSVLSKGLVYLQTHMGVMSSSSLMTIGGAILCLVCYYAYETFVEI